MNYTTGRNMIYRSLGIDEPISLTNTEDVNKRAGTYWFHRDGLGSVTEITDKHGKTIAYYDYSVYGQVTITTPNGKVLSESRVGNPYTFTGRRLDAETGLLYYRARMYFTAAWKVPPRRLLPSS